MKVYVVTMVSVDQEDEERVPDNVGVFQSLCGAMEFIGNERNGYASEWHAHGKPFPWAEDWQWRQWGERRVLTRTDCLDYWAIEAVEVKP